MGTAITLDVAEVSITYSKNHRGIDHGFLFQEKDRKAVASDQLNYGWYVEEGEDPTSAEMAFTRLLNQVIPRLELLGSKLGRVHREYNAFTRDWLKEIQDDDELTSDLMSFAEFSDFVTLHSLSSLDSSYIFGSDEESNKMVRGRFDGVQFERIPG